MKRIFFALAIALLAAPPSVHAQDRPGMERQPRGWLGLQIEEADGRLRIGEVAPDSPAERAGIREGDVLLRLNGGPATRAGVDRLRLAPGDSVRVRVGRDDRERSLVLVAAPRPARTVVVRTPERTITLNVDSLQRVFRVQADTLGAVLDSTLRRLRGRAIRVEDGVLRLDGEEIRLREMDRALLEPALLLGLGTGRRALAGAEWSELNPELGRYFGAERGVLVLRVAPESPAARSGLRAGDVVTRAGEAEVSGLRELRRAVERADDHQLRLRVLREQRPREILLRWKGGRGTVR